MEETWGKGGSGPILCHSSRWELRCHFAPVKKDQLHWILMHLSVEILIILYPKCPNTHVHASVFSKMCRGYATGPPWWEGATPPTCTLTPLGLQLRALSSATPRKILDTPIFSKPCCATDYSSHTVIDSRLLQFGNLSVLLWNVLHCNCVKTCQRDKMHIFIR